MNSIRNFNRKTFIEALKDFFSDLNVPMNHVADEPASAKEILKDTYKENETFQLIDNVYFVGMIDDAAFEENNSLAIEEIKSDYDGILIFGVTLKDRANGLLPTRSQLAEISRAFNREFYYTPVVIVFKYQNYLAFANTERLKYKQEWREGEKAGKVSLLRDINIEHPHSGHERILNELKIPTTGTKKVDSFAKLYAYWQEVFSVSLLNKKFYQELSNWYFWATKHVVFPGEPTDADAHLKNAKLEDLLQEHRATNVIRMLTRLLFVWFIKEKKLIPEELFDLETLQKDYLKEISPYHDDNSLFKDGNKNSIYYKAILQNLFFATLNCPIKSDGIDKRERSFRGEGYGTHRGIDYLMRYKEYFKNPDAFLEKLNQVVPFLNGGLFECLDDKFNNVYIDGFSDQMTKGEQLVVPDYLFFGLEEQTDLSDIIGDKKYKNAAVKGLINILKSYKFTITENTPIEEDVALDPELLGKVFENLLASYNPETKTTARKQTGSFYTPREIVNYMVDESLIAYLKNNVPGASSFGTSQSRDDLGTFFNPFGTSQSKDALGTFFNPNDEIEIKQGNLPHWNQKEVFYHVTFRLADSIPKDKVEQLKIDRENWIKNHKDKKEFTKEELKEYNRLFNDRVEEWLNAGYGSCLLKKKENAHIVANALKHFDGQRYNLDEWVVMPNHIHVLVKPIGENKLSDILHSWKSFTANEINKREGRSGQLWMHESYDHIVRNEKALNAIRHYIRQNPVKAGIVPGASSFGTSQSKDVVGTLSQSKDALDTLLHQLVSFDNTNPFKDDEDTTRAIITALSSCTILDPACGSGAFPMGVLQKMVHILQKLDPENKIWKEVQGAKAEEQTLEAFDTLEDKHAREQRLLEINDAFDQSINDPDYARKLFLIENCIYGVDIQPIATQISKLRFFISLVTDQKVNPEKENFGIRPLPNLETKFVAANTLIGIEKENNLFSTDEIKALEKQLKKVRSKLFSARTKETKLKYREQDKDLRNQIADALKDQGLPLESAEKLAAWDPYDQNTSSPFFDPEWMFDIKDGFDVVIGNPPYIQMQKDGGLLADMYKNKGYETYERTGDIYSLFYENGINLLKFSGVLTYITSNKWMRAGYGKSTRAFFCKHQPLALIDLGADVFESATVDTNILIIEKLAQKNKNCTVKALGLTQEKNLSDFAGFADKWVTVDNLTDESWTISSPLEQSIRAKIERIGTPLKDWDIQIYRGILTGFNEAFIIDGATKDRLIADDPKSAEIIKPILRGRDIKRYKAEFADLWLINSHNGVKGKIPRIDVIKDYPAIYKHLKQYETQLIKRQDKGDHWTNLRNCAYLEEFEKEKIVYNDICQKLTFSLVGKSIYFNNTAYFINSNSLLLLTLLNSSLLDWFYRQISVQLGNKAVRMFSIYVENIPIPKLSEQEQAPFIDLVNQILEKKENNQDTTALEQQIDNLVYRLYELSYEEAKVIDPEFPLSKQEYDALEV